jgi:hypothetical protein
MYNSVWLFPFPTFTAKNTWLATFSLDIFVVDWPASNIIFCYSTSYLFLDFVMTPSMTRCDEIAWLLQVFSYDGIHSPDCLAITAAGIAV